MTTLDIATARDDFERTISRVVEEREQVFLTREGKPVAKLVPLEIDDPTALEAARLRQWHELLMQIRSGIPEGTTPEEIEADITAASEEVRQERLARGY